MINKYDRRDKPFGNAFAIADTEVLQVLKTNFSVPDILDDQCIHADFLKEYQTWIGTTKNNKVTGLEKFQYACFTNGTTEAFDKFYSKYSSKRFRFFKGEYLYHRLSLRNNNFKWEYLEDAPIGKNDAVIISLPFSDTGNRHDEMDAVLHICNTLDVPVLIDCAYFGVCSHIDFNFEHNCIKEITFSLSKSLYVANLRIGMRLTREDDDDPLFVTNKIGYINKLSAFIGSTLLKKFTPDYIFNKYRHRQIQYCQILNVDPSNCVLFGIGDSRWNDYNRDRSTNRLSFHKFLPKDHASGIENEKR